MDIIDPAQLDSSTLNSQTSEKQLDLVMQDFKDLTDSSFNDRLGLPPQVRVALFTLAGSIIGGMGGMIHGWTEASLRYLASNSHRLPTNYNGWFFYHKRKTYYCTKGAMSLAMRTGCKVGGFVGCMFAIEAGLDRARGMIDFGNTMMAVCLPGFAYAWWNNMTKVQAKDFISKGGRIGLVFGLAQDGLNFVRGADVWYLRDFLGIKPMKLSDRLRKYVGDKPVNKKN